MPSRTITIHSRGNQESGLMSDSLSGRILEIPKPYDVWAPLGTSSSHKTISLFVREDKREAFERAVDGFFEGLPNIQVRHELHPQVCLDGTTLYFHSDAEHEYDFAVF
jgi:hypothetical protein